MQPIVPLEDEGFGQRKPFTSMSSVLEDELNAVPAPPRKPAIAQGEDISSEVAAVAQADLRAGGSSPPPSRPPPRSITGKRRKQFKSTENLGKSLGMDSAIPTGSNGDGDTGPAKVNKKPPEVDATKSDNKAGRRDRGTGSIWTAIQNKTGWGESSPTKATAAGSAGTPQDIEDITTHDDSHSKNGSNSRLQDQSDKAQNIPELKDTGDDDGFNMVVAAPPSVKVNKLKTMRELDNDLIDSQTVLNNVTVACYRSNLSILSNHALGSPEDIKEEDRPWTWDTLFAEVSSNLLKEAEELPVAAE